MNRFLKSFLSVVAVALTSWTWAAGEFPTPTYWASFDGGTTCSDKGGLTNEGFTKDTWSSEFQFITISDSNRAWDVSGDTWGTQSVLTPNETPFTLSVNAKLGTVANGVLFSFVDDATNQQGLVVRRGADVNTVVVTKSNSTTPIISAFAPNCDVNYYNYTLVAANNKLSLYVNGLAARNNASEVIGSVEATIAELVPGNNFQPGRRFGRCLDGEANGNGAIDELTAWNNVALTAEQVFALSATLLARVDIGEVRDLGIAIPENANICLKVTPQEVTTAGIVVNVATENETDAGSITWTLCADEYEYEATKSFNNGNYTLTATLLNGFESSEFSTEEAPVLAKAMTITGETALASQDSDIVRTINGVKNIVAKLSASESSPTVYGGNPKNTVGAIDGDVSISVTGGNYTAIFGGSNADNWGTGATQSINGSVLVEMSGGESMYLFGGHYRDGNNNNTAKPMIRDDITILVRDDAKITGSIVGAGVGAHNNSVNYGSENAPVDIRVKVENVQSQNTNTAFNLAMKYGFIAGGGAYATNANSTQNVWGNTHVLVTLADETEASTFVKHIVGAGLLNSGGDQRGTPVMKVSGTSNVVISAPETVTFSGKIIGGGYIDGTGKVPVGNSSVTINGGTFTGELYAGCYVVNNNNAESKVSGIATLTIDGGNFSDATIAPGATTKSKLAINKDVTIGSLQPFDEYEVAGGVVLTVNAANLSDVTAPMTLASGTGTLTIGQKRNVTFAGFGSGVVAVTVTADEIVNAALQLPVTTAVTTAPEVARFALTSVTGATITPTEIALVDGMLTITLPSMYVTVTESKSWSKAVGESSGAVLVVGGATAEGAIEITIDAEVSNAINEINITGYVKMATAEGVSFPANKVKIADGAHLELTAPSQTGEWSIPTGATLTLIGGEDESVTTTLSNKVTVADGGTLETKGYLTLSGENKVIAGGSLKVLTGCTVLNSGENNNGLCGRIEIAYGATLKSTCTDGLHYHGSPEVHVYGTLDMGDKRWTVGTNNKFYIYGGATITGAGDSHGALDFLAGTHTVTIPSANNQGTEIEIPAKLRLRATNTLVKFDAKLVNSTIVLSGIVRDAGALQKVGTGNSHLVLSGENKTYSGATTVSNGYLDLVGGTTLATSSIVVNSGTALQFLADANNTATTYSMPITNNARIDKFGAHMVTLEGIVSGDGAINVKAGSLLLTAANTGNKNVTIESDAMVDISSPGARLGYEGQASGNVVTVRGTLKVRDWNWNTDNCLGRLDHNPNRLVIDGGKIIFTANITSQRKATLNGNVTFEINKGVIYTAQEAYSGNGNLTIDGYGTLALTASDSLTANSSATVTINANATLQAAGTGTTFYRTVLGEGTIVIPEGKFLAIGESDRNLTETASGLTNFAGTLEIAGTFDARSWGGREYTIGACNIDMQEGSIVKQYGDAAAAKIVIASGKTLSGSGTIDIPVSLADGATIDATTGAVNVANDVIYNGEITVKVSDSNKKVLGTTTSVPTSYVIKQGDKGDNVLTTFMLKAGEDGIYAVEPTVVPIITVDDENVAVADSNLTAIKAAAAAQKVDVTSVVGKVLVPADGGTPAKTVDVAGLELFEDVPVTVDAGGVATVAYAFGIQNITVATIDGVQKIVVTAKVDKLPVPTQEGGVATADATPAPTFAEGVTVNLYQANGETLTPIDADSIEIDENKKIITITSEKSVEELLTLGGGTSKTLQLKVKAEKAVSTSAQ